MGKLRIFLQYLHNEGFQLARLATPGLGTRDAAGDVPSEKQWLVFQVYRDWNNVVC